MAGDTGCGLDFGVELFFSFMGGLHIGAPRQATPFTMKRGAIE
jgi:hypothetical protein